ncbi:MAG: hypothetical protein IKM09_01230 [Clostridia bacterium]|nr:hypothetical protein [Clostridia bacterium]
MENFWESEVWGFVNLIAILLISLLAANLIKKSVKPLKYSLIPTSVLGGLILLIVNVIYTAITGNNVFDTDFFASKGSATLEIITYHCLALGFIATTFKGPKEKFSKERNIEIFNTGVTTVSTYLLQGVFGMAVTIIASLLVSEIFAASGIILPFGYGQGTGQALNWGGIYQSDYGFTGGKSFGLTIAALGFISAALGGVIHLNIMRKRGKLTTTSTEVCEALNSEQIQSDDEIPMNASIDKMTVQIAIVFASYFIAYLMMYALGLLLPGLRSTLYGFNFLLGVIAATLVYAVYNWMKKAKIAKKSYINPFLMNRISGFCFDLMIIAGIAAIRLEFIKNYYLIIAILGVGGAFLTYFFLRLVCTRLFGRYAEEQFLAMYGMLTGTASTGMILLREADKDLKTPASDNLVYQNFPAIVFGFPMMLIAGLAPKNPVLTLIILFVFLAVMLFILFRSFIFKRKKK